MRSIVTWWYQSWTNYFGVKNISHQVDKEQTNLEAKANCVKPKYPEGQLVAREEIFIVCSSRVGNVYYLL